MVAVVCLTGSSGTSAHSSTPAMPATTAISACKPIGSLITGHEGRWYATHLMTQRRRAPQPAACCRTEIQSCRRGVRVVRRELLQRAPVAEPVVTADRSEPWSRAASSSVMPSGPPPMLSITGELASAPNRSGSIRHFGTSTTPFWWSIRALAREGQAHQPVQQHRVLRADHLLQRAQLRDPRRGERDPVLRRQVVVGGYQPHLRRVAGYRRQRRPQVAPRRGGADVGEPDAAGRLAVAASRRWPTARPPRPDRSARPPPPRAAARPDRRGGSRYHAERSTAGCWVPLRQLPITGVRAGSRP